MDIIVKLNEQTAGRDKIIRLLQYGSRAYWYYAQNVHSTRYSAEILRSLEFTFSSFRKLLRFGRCLDSFYFALKMMKYPDPMVRITLIMAKMTNALYLLADHFIWIGRVGIVRINLEKWNRVANKYWLLTIVMSLIRDIYEIIKILEHKKNIFKQHHILSCLKNHKEVMMDTIKNGCDLFIPLTALGITKCTPGTIGLLGIISSFIGLYTIINPLYKLSPS
ncbi:peroxisomal membrane protein 11B [Pogonomyrmex barbatus]|uniref:Peroxisomal membrane protein 11B n=1 Tax=Pogonomyrmex barbatus TaxID=144034 RepID=A0A6I9VS40_9HYME|nr:peroxisomal membrane protein 11B [Pogonomyrmex barbatus]XP_011630515.1 peroxisomal membrane protein 11B [Pogonomyrmex barbatus]